MIRESKGVVILKGQLSKFSGIISKRSKKPKQRLIREILYGLAVTVDEVYGCVDACDII